MGCQHYWGAFLFRNSHIYIFFFNQVAVLFFLSHYCLTGLLLLSSLWVDISLFHICVHDQEKHWRVISSDSLLQKSKLIQSDRSLIGHSAMIAPYNCSVWESSWPLNRTGAGIYEKIIPFTKGILQKVAITACNMSQFVSDIVPCMVKH